MDGSSLLAGDAVNNELAIIPDIRHPDYLLGLWGDIVKCPECGNEKQNNEMVAKQLMAVGLILEPDDLNLMRSFDSAELYLRYNSRLDEPVAETTRTLMAIGFVLVSDASTLADTFRLAGRKLREVAGWDKEKP